MRKFGKRSLAPRLFVLAALPSTLPIVAGIYLDAPNTPLSTERRLAQTVPTDVRGTPPALGPEARPNAPAVHAPAPALLVPPVVRPSASGAETSMSSNLSAVATTLPVQTVRFWQMPEMARFAAAYVAALALSMFGAWSILRSLHRFRDAAQEIALGRVGGNALASCNDLRDLAGVAKTVDGLVSDLQNMSDQMRISVEENAHTMRTPLATIGTAFRAVVRNLPADEPRAQRAARIIDNSLHRLSSAIDAMERNDRAIAEFLAMPRELVNVSQVVREATRELRQNAGSRNIHVCEQLQDNVLAWTSRPALASTLRDVLAGALDASPTPGEVVVTLDGSDTAGACILVEDRGGDEDVDSLFQHDFLPSGEAGPLAAGGSAPCRTGLWHVKRTLEAFGGRISAHRNLHGGVSVSVALPAMRQ
jgi:two-component system sensor histidine kinase ChvG